ncbi:HAD family hydrolase [Micromonospora echinofusca]|uniref:Putative hydrolase of the HAD superfamily n=1 Tax=Micromonospora echinofusca TaxID=47858 RepID=A0A1C5GK22_MICEH|nr:HAD family hydrolase [Micromonospora echinofusca]SCG19466.1 putative hydrolase of the HAD superfamily [Micromonospora echinofusca]
MLTDIDVVCLDIGGTVVQTPHGSFTRQLAEVLGCDFTEVRDHLQPFKARRSPVEQLAVSLAEAFGATHRKAELVELLGTLADEARRPVVFDDAAPALSRLADSGVRLAMLSNVLGAVAPPGTSPVLGLDIAVFLSCDIGVAKPSPAAFERVANALRTPASRILHVGDAYETDVLAALHAGSQAVWLRRDPAVTHPAPEAPTIGDLRELPGLLGIGPMPPIHPASPREYGGN